MSLHWLNISFDLQTTQKNKHLSPQLQDVIKSSIGHQIQHHARATPSLEHTLIARTKKILSDRYVSSVGVSCQENENKEEMKKSKGVMSRSRREWRVNQTKKQLELLNQLYRNIQKNKVKQFCQQIKQKQAEIHMTLTHNNFRKTYMSSNPKPSRQIKQRQIKTSQIRQSLTPKMRTQKQKESQVIYDRLNPYRRLQIVKHKGRDLVQPWEVNN